MCNLQENEKQKHFADFSAYLQLKKMNYTDKDIMRHMSCTKEYLQIIKGKFDKY